MRKFQNCVSKRIWGLCAGLFLNLLLGYSQIPVRLTTDLLEHTDRLFLDGYPSTLTLDRVQTAIERYQIAEIRRPHPYLGWVIKSDKPNTMQAAYRILLATSPDSLKEETADMWDSGMVESDNSVSVLYDGKPLQPSTIYYWTVKIKDNFGRESAYAVPKCFMTAANLDHITARYPLQKNDEYPLAVAKIDTASWFVDFGKAAFGQLKLTLTSELLSDTVTVHLGERAQQGRVDRAPGASIRYTRYRLPLLQGRHTYLLKITPDKRNTDLHANESGVSPILMPDCIGEVYPFRYCEVEGYRGTLHENELVRQTVHYPFNEYAACFSSSDSVLNAVWELCKYSIKVTSFAGVYVDGDRERIPYEADALINQLCHYTVDREYAMPRYSWEHLIYHATWPTEWIMQSLIMAWNDYMYTGNRAALERCYDDLQAKTLLALKEVNGLISVSTGKQTASLLQAIHFKGKALRDIVDWPREGGFGLRKEDPGEADRYVLTDYNTVVNAYHYRALVLMSDVADVLGHADDAQKYRAEALRVGDTINRLLFDRKRKCYVDGLNTEHASLHANMFPMAFGLVPEKYRDEVGRFIRSRGLACSVYGSQFLLDAVYEANDASHGLSLLTSTDERSWYNMLREGSTVTMEAWGTRYKPNLDWNHAWGAAPANLIPRKLMGVEPIEPGFRKIRIKPQPDTLRHASLRMPTIRGSVEVEFENIPQQHFQMRVEIPANAIAEVWLPCTKRHYSLTIDGEVCKGIYKEGFVKVEIGSGHHLFLLE